MDAIVTDVSTTQRCVIVVDRALPPGKAANAAAVVALTLGQRHPHLVGEPLVDASGASTPGLIPIGIAVLAADQDELAWLRARGTDRGCDVIAFPIQGQQTTDYAVFRAAVSEVPTGALAYVAVALVGERKSVGKLVGRLALLR